MFEIVISHKNLDTPYKPDYPCAIFLHSAYWQMEYLITAVTRPQQST